MPAGRQGAHDSLQSWRRADNCARFRRPWREVAGDRPGLGEQEEHAGGIVCGVSLSASERTAAAGAPLGRRRLLREKPGRSASASSSGVACLRLVPGTRQTERPSSTTQRSWPIVTVTHDCAARRTDVSGAAPDERVRGGFCDCASLYFAPYTDDLNGQLVNARPRCACLIPGIRHSR